jgi:hypothetical protein
MVEVSWHYLLTSVILTTWEAEIRMIGVLDKPKRK